MISQLNLKYEISMSHSTSSGLLGLLSISSLLLIFCPGAVLTRHFLSERQTPAATVNPLVKEIQCYSLPYGGIGFASHVLTYYTIAMLLALSRRPYLPWLRTIHSKSDIVLTAISIIITITASAITMKRCQHRWEFMAIAAWKLDLSVMFSFISFHAAFIIPKHKDEYSESSRHDGSYNVLF